MAVAADPRKLLIPDPDVKKTVLHDKFVPICLTTASLATVLGARHFTRRPMLSGVQHYIMAVIGGWVVGKLLHNKIESLNAEKDAIYMHYIDLHPEAFPTPRRIKIGEKFEPWAPVR